MPRSHPRVSTYLLWGCAGYVGVAAAVWVLPIGGQGFKKAFWDLYPLIVQLAAGIGAWRAVQSPELSRPARRAWATIGLAVACHTIADGLWAHDELVGASNPAGHFAVNALYIATYFGFIVGTALMIREEGRRNGVLSILDGIVVSGSVGLAAWDRFYRIAWESSPLPASAKAIVAAYPLADLVLLTGAVCLFLDMRPKVAGRSLLWVAALCNVVWADVAYSFEVLSGTYQTGRWLDFFWLVGLTLIACSCLTAGERRGLAAMEPDSARPDGARPSGVLPALFALLVTSAVFVADLASGNAPAVSTLWVGIVVLGIVVFRQAVQAVRQRNATEAGLRELAGKLERQAIDRTRRLSGMLQLAHAVNSSLEVERVLQAAAKEVFQAIPCDGLLIWQAGVASTWLFEAEERPVVLGTRSDALLEARDLLEVDRVGVVREAAYEGGDEVLAAPLRTAGEHVGWIALLRAEGEFGTEDAELLDAMGEIVGPALDHAVTYERVSLSTNLDPVTGLLNHRAVHQLLGALFNQAKDEGLELTVLMADLANFRMFNATYGHPVGDQVLSVVAGALQAECSKGVVSGRFGGDEFIVVLPNCGAESATQLAARFNRRLQTGYRLSEGQAIPLSLCVGIATFPSDCDTYEELLDVANRNLASARLGDVKVVCTSPTQQAAKSLRANPTYETLDVLVAAVDNKDSYTRRHSEEVAEYAQYAAQEMGCSEDALRLIQTAALLHDVGKIGVPPEILAKPARLTEEETAIINRHAWIGSMIVSAFPGPEGLADIIKCHHERWDGTGYPDGRKGEDIPWISRLLAIADTYSAMTTNRPYRSALSWQVALAEIEKQAGSQFDPELAAAFVKAIGAQMSVEEAMRDRSVSSRAA